MNLIQFKEQVHQKMTSLRQNLREAFKTKDSFSIGDIIDKRRAIDKWGTKADSLEGQKQIIKAAKKGESLAQQFVFWKLEPKIQTTFWKNYLGPNNSVRRSRITNGDAWEDWVGICWQEIFGGGENRKGETTRSLIEYYDEDKTTYGSAFAGLANVVGQALIGAATSENYRQRAGGITGVAMPNSHDTEAQRAEKMAVLPSVYNPQFSDSDLGVDSDSGDDLGANTKGVYEDSTFDTVYEEDEAHKFLKKWKAFCQDEELQKLGKAHDGKEQPSPAKILAELFDPHASFPAIAEKYGLSKGSVANYKYKAESIVSKYDVASGLHNAMKIFGADKLVSYLANPGVKSSVAEPAKELIEDPAQVPNIKEEPKTIENIDKTDAPKVKSKSVRTKTKTFKQRLQDAQEDPAMWKGIRGTDPANVLCVSLMHPRYDFERLGKEFGIPYTQARTYLHRALEILAKYGIEAEELNDMCKKHGGAKIASMIGEDA